MNPEQQKNPSPNETNEQLAVSLLKTFQEKGFVGEISDFLICPPSTLEGLRTPMPQNPTPPVGEFSLKEYQAWKRAQHKFSQWEIAQLPVIETVTTIGIVPPKPPESFTKYRQLFHGLADDMNAVDIQKPKLSSRRLDIGSLDFERYKDEIWMDPIRIQLLTEILRTNFTDFYPGLLTGQKIRSYDAVIALVFPEQTLLNDYLNRIRTRGGYDSLVTKDSSMFNRPLLYKPSPYDVSAHYVFPNKRTELPGQIPFELTYEPSSTRRRRISHEIDHKVVLNVGSEAIIKTDEKIMPL